MKKLIVIIIAAVLTCYTSSVTARGWEQAMKEKKVHNQYTVQDMDRLVIENMYGKVHINTWDKNEVTIDITVTVKARNESEAQEILDRISFVTSSNDDGGHKIYYKTVLESSKHNNQNSSMTIDYVINAPKKNAIDITNKFGDVYLGNFSGKMRMNVSYGALDMQTITGADKRIKVAFGSANVNSIESGDFDVSYSNITIDKAGDIVVINKFGKLDLGDIHNLRIDQRYGDIEINSIEQITGTVDYADVVIGDLHKSMLLTLKYCGRAEVRSVGQGVDYINVDAHYSGLHYHFAEGANLSILIATTYSSLKGSIPGQLFEHVDNNNTSYKAKVGKGDGSMLINAHYSSINLK